MTCLGIDPGLASTGWGVVVREETRLRALGWGAIVTPADWETGRRLAFLRSELEALIGRYRPLACGVETLSFRKNVSSALPVAQARGVVLLTLYERAIAVHELTPGQVKKAVVGLSRAEKAQVAAMVCLLLNLGTRPSPDHAADALAMAYAALVYGEACRVP